jgi:hypothetical protein
MSPHTWGRVEKLVDHAVSTVPNNVTAVWPVQPGPPGAYIVDSRGVWLEDDHFRLFAEGDRPEVCSYTRDQSCIIKSHVDAKEEFQILDY